ncbi:MAG: hypothetical protein KDD38_07570 [Bdellovibrionales bacterium]|nr:hypothetical protein [Bdellovibrionales bacterium]
MRSLVAVLTFVALFASQAFGAALCPTLCSNVQMPQVEKASSHCQQKDNKMSTPVDMPLDCSVMAMLKSLSVLNISNVDFAKNCIDDTQFVVHFENPVQVLHNVAVLRPYISGKAPPLRARPLFLLNQSFII